MGRSPKFGIPNTPIWFLGRYKTTQRPRPCVRCGQNAYYYHPDWDYVCAPHLLDLVNIGGNAFNWGDYPEVWNRTERLLRRPSTTVLNTTQPLDNSVVTKAKQWDGKNDE